MGYKGRAFRITHSLDRDCVRVAEDGEAGAESEGL